MRAVRSALKAARSLPPARAGERGLGLRLQGRVPHAGREAVDPDAVGNERTAAVRVSESTAALVAA